jgi:translation elongation factor EF-G
MSSLISPQLRVAYIGQGLDQLAQRLGTTQAGQLTEADVAIFAVSAKTGIDATGQELWAQAREFYIPTLLAITDLGNSEIDFDDMAAIAGKTLDPVVTPYLVLHDDNGAPAALIDLDSLKVISYRDGLRVERESDPEHKLLVFDFRKEYLESLEAAGEDAFSAALLFPAIPLIDDLSMGVHEIAHYLETLTITN